MDDEYDERPRRGRAPDADERDSDRRPPRGSSNRTVWLVLGAAGCGLLLVCSGPIAVVIWMVKSFATDIPVAQGAADQFLNCLQGGRIDDAYALTSTQFRAKQSPEQFAGFVTQFETFTRHTSRTQTGTRMLLPHDRGKHVYIQMTLNAPNNAMTCSLVLIKEAGVWKVEKLTVP